MWSKHFETLKQSSKKNKYLLINTFISKIFAIIVQNYEKFFSKFRKKLKSRKKFKVRFFSKFKNKVVCFDVKKINKLFSRCTHDHKIDFISKIKSSNKKIYDLNKNQIEMIKAYVNEMLDKNFIRNNFFHFSISILIVKKSKKKFRICVNYRTLNALTIKNRNCSSLIRETFVRLCVVKFYIKLNVIAIFNEIRIRKNDEHKTVFFIKYELYEYVVMFFDFCNVFEIFQSFINDILRKYLNDFCNAYLNDVFIYNKTKKKHIVHVRKVFDKFHVVDFFLNINKCEFYVNEMKYFDFIIIIENIKMNSKKMQIIFEWKIFQNIKNVQIFLNFVNFYRKFICEYFKLIQFFTTLIRVNEKNFIFFWNFNDFEKKFFFII